jgi:lysophospholipase L1-like esterase
MSRTRPRYVALGSSFAAGPGIDPVVDRAADRSGRNYPHLLARRLGLELVDRTVSGATTATILDQVQETEFGSLPPQIDGITPGTDLVTITAGGNDLGYIGYFIDTAWQNHLGEDAAEIVQPGPSAVQEAADGLVRIVEAARRRAPGCRLVLVDYLPILDPGSTDAAPSFLPGQVPALLRLQGTLQRVFAAAAERAGAELLTSAVRPDHDREPHGVTAPVPWIQPLVEDPAGVGASFHPNAAGMAAVADRLARMLRG